jgi:hypothetical protein
MNAETYFENTLLNIASPEEKRLFGKSAKQPYDTYAAVKYQPKTSNL